MSVKNDDANFIKLSPAVFISIILGIAGLGASIGTTKSSSPNHDELAAIDKNYSDLRETAKAALAVSAENAKWISENRQLIYDRTADRRTAAEAAAAWRAQSERDAQQERQLKQLERDIDRLDKAGK